MTDAGFRLFVTGMLIAQFVLTGFGVIFLTANIGTVRDKIRDLRWALFPEDEVKYEAWSRETDEVFGK